jgi:uncharacterized membrane protein
MGFQPGAARETNPKDTYYLMALIGAMVFVALFCIIGAVVLGFTGNNIASIVCVGIIAALCAIVGPPSTTYTFKFLTSTLIFGFLYGVGYYLRKLLRG